MTGSMSPVHERRWKEHPDLPIIEWTFDKNIHMTYMAKYGNVSWMTIEVEDGVVDLTRLDNDFVEDRLLEPLQDAGFEVEYETETKTAPSLIRRFARFIIP